MAVAVPDGANRADGRAEDAAEDAAEDDAAGVGVGGGQSGCGSVGGMTISYHKTCTKPLHYFGVGDSLCTWRLCNPLTFLSLAESGFPFKCAAPPLKPFSLLRFPLRMTVPAPDLLLPSISVWQSPFPSIELCDC